MRDLKGKTALLTGASRGIGVYLARALADRGMNLALVARSAEGLQKVKAELEPRGVKVLCVPTDVGDRAALEALVERVQVEFGTIDVLVNNAGLEQGEIYTEFSRDGIQQIIDVNLTAPMLLTHLVLPGMLKQGEGHVVNIASGAGLAGIAYNETYSATKHGLVGFTRSLVATAEGEGWPVGFSTILPGFVADAGMYEDMRAQTGMEAPALFGTSPPEKVATATLRAIEKDLLEVIVNPRPFRPIAIFLLLFPGRTKWFGRTSGAIAWFKAVVEQRHRQLPSKT